MASKLKIRELKGFSDRLNAICDAKHYPQRGRRQHIARLLKNVISAEAVRKWLEGETMPDQVHMSMLATALGVTVDSLQTGRATVNAEPQLDAEMRQLLVLWRSLDSGGRAFVMRAAVNESIASAARRDVSTVR